MNHNVSPSFVTGGVSLWTVYDAVSARIKRKTNNTTAIRAKIYTVHIGV